MLRHYKERSEGRSLGWLVGLTARPLHQFKLELRPAGGVLRVAGEERAGAAEIAG